MSTLYDALKRAEAERKGDKGFSSRKASVKKSASPTQDEGSDTIKIIVLLVLVICVFGFVFYRIKSLKQKSASAPANVQQKAAEVATTLAPAKVRAPGTYELDGIVEAGEGSMAVVNGKLLQLEGSIDHLVLKKILPKQVELLNTKDDSIVVLKINR